MAARLRLPTLTTIILDPDRGESLQRQVYHRIRDLIDANHVRPGTRLPSTRALASELRVSRNTVLAAFDRLTAEGYIDVRRGAGSYVSTIRPDETMAVTGMLPSVTSSRAAWPPHALRPFCLGGLPSEIFPLRVWERLLLDRWRYSSRRILGPVEPDGCPELREAVAMYLRTARGVRCSADQVIIVSGSQQALDLTARVLVRPGDQVWIEDPGSPATRSAFEIAGARLIPVPVDAGGIDPAAGMLRAPSPRCVYLTPASQFPTTAVLSAERRAALMRLTRDAGTCIIEDDHAAAFRYSGRPLPAMQGADDAGRVVYLGSFSTVIGPALGIGYLVVPPALRDEFAVVQRAAGAGVSTLEQLVLAKFIEDGYFAGHLRRLRAACAERQDALLDAIHHELSGSLCVTRVETGTQLIADIDPDLELGPQAEGVLAAQATREGVELLPLSALRMEPGDRRAVLLGFSGFGPSRARRAIRTLASIFRRLDTRAGRLPASA